ncbi:hypothetical protein KUCAC02_011978 [Chaenocephalus aceratus]|uniref:Uncharacterized protein n=1 Tax=Chaenocephalus aceratus TaxID=36190 RepID=A0ACB9XAD8_CHAAC|nr:hypothetical protein KUCAC02_011978 [Chaenocephalus aceratus]
MAPCSTNYSSIHQIRISEKDNIKALHTGPLLLLLLLLSCSMVGLRVEQTEEELLALWSCWRPCRGATGASVLEVADKKCTESLQQLEKPWL